MDTANLNSLAINKHGFIFDPESGYSYNANQTAILIISQLKEGKSIDEISANLLERFDVDKGVLTTDIEFFVSRLNLFGMIKGE